LSVRSVAQLDYELDKRSAWRKKELTTLRFIVDSAVSHEQDVICRAAAALLYAQWEGFVKDAGTLYLQFISNQDLKLGELTENLMALCAKGRIKQCSKSDNIAPYIDVVILLSKAGGKSTAIPWKNAIETRSNLDGDALENIARMLGLDFSPYAIKRKTVIDRLVHLRNGIAHGVGYPVDRDDYDMLHKEIVGLIDRFRDQVTKAAEDRAYMVAA